VTPGGPPPQLPRPPVWLLALIALAAVAAAVSMLAGGR
jgi:hypothetical protein